MFINSNLLLINNLVNKLVKWGHNNWRSQRTEYKMDSTILQQLLTQLVANQQDLQQKVAQLSTPGSLFNQLATRIGKFNYDPLHARTFRHWYIRNKATFDNDANRLTSSKSKCELLLHALEDAEYQRLVNRLLPKKPEDFDNKTFPELVQILETQFGDCKTLFQRRMEALTFKAPSYIKVATLYEQLNSLGDTFQFGELTEEKFKILLLALSMHGPENKQKRAIVFKSMAENAELTFANIFQLLQAHEDRSADTQLMQEPEQLQAIYQKKRTNKQFNYRAKPQQKFSLKCSRCNSEKHA